MTDRALPPAVLEMHVGILGKTGSGKSNLAKSTVEALLDEGARVCVIDPTGTWFGLRLTPERKPSRYQVVMFGGRHADIAIGRTHGAAVAETIGTTTTPAVIDTRTMTVGERTEFFTGFAETLLQRNQGPLHLVIDEAHLFAPQGRVADPKSGQMLHAANNLVSLGRGVGLRIILISQRPAKLHKDSLTQIETLVAMRLIAPQDRRAIEDWIGEWAEPKQGAELIASLPSLPTGEAWIWSPEIGLLERRKTSLAQTLDTGKPSSEPVELGTIEIDTVKARLAQVAADVVANDPRELRRRIRALEQEITKRPTEMQVETVEKVVEVPVLNGKVERLETAIGSLNDIGQALIQVGSDVRQAAHEISTAIANVRSRSPVTPMKGRVAETPRGVSGPVRKSPEPRGWSAPVEPTAMPPLAAARPASEGEVRLGQAERTFLAALAQHPTGLSRTRLSLITGYSSKSGHFANVLGRLRGFGFVARGEPIRITDEGVAQLDDVRPLPAPGPELVEYWRGRLGRAERAFLDAFVDVWPDALSREELAERTGYSSASGHFANVLGRIRGLGLIEGWRASDELMGQP